MEEKLDNKENVVHYVDIDCVKPNPNQPRKTFEESPLDELASSIGQYGILQPLLVEEISPNSFRIIAGERRYRASLKVGLKKIPVIVRNYSNMERLEISIIENVQRENLNPIEEAYAYMYLIQEGNMTQEEVAKKISKSRSAIANSIRLITLSAPMRDALSDGAITAGHARALLAVKNPSEREILFQRILSDGLNVREAERLANFFNNGGRASNISEKKILNDDDVSNLKDSNTISSGLKSTKEALQKTFDLEKTILKETSNKFYNLIGMNTAILGTFNKGKILISFSSAEQLEKLYKILGGKDELYPEEEE